MRYLQEGLGREHFVRRVVHDVADELGRGQAERLRRSLPGHLLLGGETEIPLQRPARVRVPLQIFERLVGGGSALDLAPCPLLREVLTGRD